jgi:hypothetical protein
MNASGPVTLSDLIADHKLFWAYCTDGGRERDLDPRNLPLPGGTPVPSVGGRMKCSACGSRKINAKPELYHGGIIAMRERRR